MLGIIGAMDIEVQRVVAALENVQERSISTAKYWKGTLNGHEVVVAKCGVGKVSAAICAQIMISEYGVEMIINTGVGGALLPELRQCDLVVADAFVQHDVDTTAIGDEYGYISALGVIKVPASKLMSDIVMQAARDQRESDYKIHRGIIATGDQFIAEEERAQQIVKAFNAAVCDMEGGAIAQVCAMAGIQFTAVRCISDNADGSAGLSYAAFAPIAAARCAHLIIEFVRRLFN